MLDEKQIKIALISRLKEKGYLRNDAIYIDELTIGNERRADLVVANGKLSAFEIKSDFDTLNRLPGQLSTYKRTFHKVVIVCVEKHLEKVKAITDADVEIWTLSKISSGDYHWKIVRRGKSARSINKSSLLSIGNRNELFRLLKESRISASSKLSRYEMDLLARNLPYCTIQSYFLNLLKGKYRKYHSVLDSKIEKGEELNKALSTARRFRPGYQAPQPSHGERSNTERLLVDSKSKSESSATSSGLFAIPKGG